MSSRGLAFRTSRRATSTPRTITSLVLSLCCSTLVEWRIERGFHLGIHLGIRLSIHLGIHLGIHPCIDSFLAFRSYKLKLLFVLIFLQDIGPRFLLQYCIIYIIGLIGYIMLVPDRWCRAHI